MKKQEKEQPIIISEESEEERKKAGIREKKERKNKSEVVSQDKVVPKNKKQNRQKHQEEPIDDFFDLDDVEIHEDGSKEKKKKTARIIKRPQEEPLTNNLGALMPPEVKEKFQQAIDSSDEKIPSVKKAEDKKTLPQKSRQNQKPKDEPLEQLWKEIEKTGSEETTPKKTPEKIIKSKTPKNHPQKKEAPQNTKKDLYRIKDGQEIEFKDPVSNTFFVLKLEEIEKHFKNFDPNNSEHWRILANRYQKSNNDPELYNAMFSVADELGDKPWGKVIANAERKQNEKKKKEPNLAVEKKSEKKLPPEPEKPLPHTPEATPPPPGQELDQKKQEAREEIASLARTINQQVNELQWLLDDINKFDLDRIKRKEMPEDQADPVALQGGYIMAITQWKAGLSEKKNNITAIEVQDKNLDDTISTLSEHRKNVQPEFEKIKAKKEEINKWRIAVNERIKEYIQEEIKRIIQEHGSNGVISDKDLLKYFELDNPKIEFAMFSDTLRKLVNDGEVDSSGRINESKSYSLSQEEQKEEEPLIPTEEPAPVEPIPAPDDQPDSPSSPEASAGKEEIPNEQAEQLKEGIKNNCRILLSCASDLNEEGRELDTIRQHSIPELTHKKALPLLEAAEKKRAEIGSLTDIASSIQKIHMKLEEINTNAIGQDSAGLGEADLNKLLEETILEKRKIELVQERTKGIWSKTNQWLHAVRQALQQEIDSKMFGKGDLKTELSILFHTVKSFNTTMTSLVDNFNSSFDDFSEAAEHVRSEQTETTNKEARKAELQKALTSLSPQERKKLMQKLQQNNNK